MNPKSLAKDIRTSLVTARIALTAPGAAQKPGLLATWGDAFNNLGGILVLSKATRAVLRLALILGIVSVAHAASNGKIVTSDPSKHFDSKGKLPSKYTIELQKGLRATLPFDDKREEFVVELSNSVLTNIKGAQAKHPDLTITIKRSDLERVMSGTATFDQLIQEGKASFDGNRRPFDLLRSAMVRFTPDFELIPGTKAAKEPASAGRKDPFEMAAPADSSGD